jgi:hypothetical protein
LAATFAGVEFAGVAFVGVAFAGAAFAFEALAFATIFGAAIFAGPLLGTAFTVALFTVGLCADLCDFGLADAGVAFGVAFARFDSVANRAGRPLPTFAAAFDGSAEEARVLFAVLLGARSGAGAGRLAWVPDLMSSDSRGLGGLPQRARKNTRAPSPCHCSCLAPSFLARRPRWGSARTEKAILLDQLRTRVLAPFALAVALSACIVPEAGKPSSDPARPDKRIVWDGDLYSDSFDLGRTRGGPPPRHAQHWVHCAGDGCRATLAVTSNGRDASHGLEFHGEGSGWMGFGFAWAGYNRQWATLDVSPFEHLSFWMRVALRSGTLGDLNVSLHNPDQGSQAGSARLSEYVPGDLADGQWHRVLVPLRALAASEPKLDLRRVWDFALGSDGGARSFDIYLDELAFEGRGK